jgi:light-regulated signal transduction histidine kinase (bacteriophytochrome)
MPDHSAQRSNWKEAGDVGEGVAEAHTPADRESMPPTSLRGKTLLGHAKVIAHLREPAAPSQSGDHVKHGFFGNLPEQARSFISLSARELAQRVCDRAQSHAAAKEVKIVLDCECENVWVHPQAFAEALYELLKNAIQATRKHHPVTLGVRETGKGEVLWQIRDGGEGMSDQVLAELGQPPRSAWQGGPGLGVAYAWAVIEQHGGLLRFESAPGAGTTASIWLPALS